MPRPVGSAAAAHPASFLNQGGINVGAEIDGLGIETLIVDVDSDVFGLAFVRSC